MLRSSLFLLAMCLWLAVSFDQHDDFKYIMHYYEEYSQYPIVHTYYNHHFQKSKQFEDFLGTVEQTEYRNKDHAKFLMTNCQKLEIHQSNVCDEMRRTKDNHHIVGYYPSGEFISYAGKRMQNPPKSKVFRHPSDVYTVEEFQRFLHQMLPNFFEDLNSLQKFEHWLMPRYSPNLIIATREDEIPQVIAQLSINYFLRFDMGYLNDLTESVVNHLNITSFPTLLVLRYNFEQNIHEMFRYPGKDLSTSNYQDIKSFLEPLSLKERRNDLLYHKMKMPEKIEMSVTDRVDELDEILDRANGWVFVEETSGRPEKLQFLKQKYGRFFQYVHLVNSSQSEELIKLYDPDRRQTFELPKADLDWKTLNKDDFVTNTSVFLNKGFVVMGVRQEYSHFCTLALNTFFKGLTQCFIIDEDDYEETSKKIKMQFDIGFVCYQKLQKGETKVSGNNFKTADFEDVYLTAQYQTRLKSKVIIDDFFQKPIKTIESTEKVANICAFPYKKCAILFTDSNKVDRTAYEYLKDAAQNFINEYQFYEVDVNCNEHFKQQIQHLKKTSNGLIVYHPRKESYVYLKAKLSRTTFERFLKANLVDDKRLPFRKWNNPEIKVHSCKKDVADKKEERPIMQQKTEMTYQTADGVKVVEGEVEL